MPSRSSNAQRRAPQQDRSTKRLQTFLSAAEALFAELGFEATTMTAVADKADSSIGALYGYYPDKKAIAIALLDAYAEEIEKHWEPVLRDIGKLSAAGFSELFVDSLLMFVAEHPAFLQLAAAPVRLRRSAAAKRAFRAPLTKALSLRSPSLTAARVELCANVMLQIVHGMMQLYTDADRTQRQAVIEEFKIVLSSYLHEVFRADRTCAEGR